MGTYVKTKIITLAILAATGIALGAGPAHAVDPRQEHNVSKCYFDKNQSAKEREKYCKALEGRPMTEAAKNCLLRAGVGGAAALVVGRVNKKVAREIAVNVAGAGAAACLSSMIK
ncbi:MULTISPECIES: hypothetical protein [unclassified Streptomyces]|uniref:hypothetical protein n=1 Tax=unclassified Streptomyces TaxID=2593676 RepID=UPI0004BEB404|nr:hypothetical protein [Streptomyces sp. NRRL S-241]